jgi:hypothetical protein
MTHMWMGLDGCLEYYLTRPAGLVPVSRIAGEGGSRSVEGM